MSTKVQRNHITILNIYKYITKYLNTICIIFEMCIIIHTNFTNHNTVLLMYVMMKMLYEIAFGHGFFSYHQDLYRHDLQILKSNFNYLNTKI